MHLIELLMYVDRQRECIELIHGKDGLSTRCVPEKVEKIHARKISPAGKWSRRSESGARARLSGRNSPIPWAR